MNPASESRPLPPFLAIAASLVLVCGGLLLLTSTMPWSTPPASGSDTPTATAADAPAEAPVSATIALAPQLNDGMPSASDETAEADGDTIAETAAVQPPEPQQAGAAPAETVQSDPSPVSEDGVLAASSVPDADEPPADVAEAAAIDATQANADDVAQIDETEAGAAEAIAAESMNVSEAKPMAQDAAAPSAMLETAQVQAELAETKPAGTPHAAIDQTGTLLAETKPAAIAIETIAEHDNEGTPASPEAPDTEKTEAPSDAPAQATDVSAREGSSEEARAEVAAAASPPPLPRRKPEIAPASPVQIARSAEPPKPAPRAEAPKPTATRPVAVPQTQAQSGGPQSRWLPMALAPADKPIAAAPTRLSGPSYSSRVWSALARSKPRAGQSGSATVSFTIGWGGSLSSARIARSSGNARIDQLALATVRGAAFPAPASGPASFTIRIDFH